MVEIEIGIRSGIERENIRVERLLITDESESIVDSGMKEQVDQILRACAYLESIDIAYAIIENLCGVEMGLEIQDLRDFRVGRWHNSLHMA